MRLFILTFLIFVCSYGHSAQVSLIIDDMGNNLHDALAFTLPPEVTFAILPNKPLSTSFSKRAAEQHREVILHMPMESLARVNQEKGVLLSSMQPEEIVQTLNRALATVPNAIGMNNHMGSRLTQLSLPMSVTMDYLFKRGLFFVDSRTTRFSKAELIAQKVGVLNTKRNVFIDHVVKVEEMDKQFHRLLRLAKKYGHAVGIAHPHAATLKYLNENILTIETQGLSLVKLSDVLNESAELASINASETDIPTL